MSQVARPVSLTLAALGGQGGGVVSNWLAAVARREQYQVQATSVPGVAQRTGATIYYLEFFPERELPADGRRPVLALMPSPGDVDIVVASEFVEAGRMMQRGLVTPERTTLIASTHRTYTISEKSHRGDSRANVDQIDDEARMSARRYAAFDMAAIAEQHGAVISAVILGAIAGAAGLPFALESYRKAIRDSGMSVDRNLAAFDAGATRAAAALSAAKSATSASAIVAPALPTELRLRIDQELPALARETAAFGVARLLDYQDSAYAEEYLLRLAPFAKFDHSRDDTAAELTTSVARGLALWMSVEDTIRVADLKTRPGRTRRVRDSASAKSGQIVQITNFLRPRLEEICGTLPATLGARLRASSTATRWLSRWTRGREIRTSTITGYLSLRAIAGLRRWRRGTLRFREEQQRVERWLLQLQSLAVQNYALAVELAHCQSLVRGYGDTYERGVHEFEKLASTANNLAARDDGAAELRRLREQTLAA